MRERTRVRGRIPFPHRGEGWDEGDYYALKPYPLVAFTFAIIFLGKKLTLAKSAGAILAVSGILLLDL